MGRIRKIGVAAVLAGVMAVSFGATLSAAKKPGGGGGGGKGGTVCDYLTAIIQYDYTTPTVMLYTLSLYDYYNCSAQ